MDFVSTRFIAALETLVDLVCMFEFTIRLVVCPNKRNFLTNIYTWIDFFAAYPPLAIRIAVGFTLPKQESAAKIILVCFVPIVRLFKMLRHFEQFRLLLNAFELAFEALPVLMYMLLMITLMASAGVYTSEPRTNIESLPAAIWLSVVTISTVGYGDVYPTTTGGRTCIIALIITSILYMPVPLGIIGGAFTQVWNDRDRILLMQRTRDRLKKWGYSPEDIPLLFEMADEDGTGEVDLDEFRDLIKNMKIGLSEERIVMLFNSFDEDASGTVDAKEFIRNIFPGHFCAIYSVERTSTIGKSATTKSGGTSFLTSEFRSEMRSSSRSPSQSRGLHRSITSNTKITIEAVADALTASGDALENNHPNVPQDAVATLHPPAPPSEPRPFDLSEYDIGMSSSNARAFRARPKIPEENTTSEDKPVATLSVPEIEDVRGPGSPGGDGLLRNAAETRGNSCVYPSLS